ncbi:MAG: hypothetical protein HOC71_19500 [Candidatus Latescibacteria bacterium]|jgi:hypothetical protein|nr:hypothetical protein [Candidatus Latescibacterota bacterium]
MKNKDVLENNTSCDKYRPPKEYTHIQEFIDNLPYILMIVIGGTINVIGFKLSVFGLISAGVYIIYGIVGALWIILFVCPYCHFFNTRACPCGYGQIAAKFREKNSENKFAEKFKIHIPVIVPLWIIPVIEGIIFLTIDFDRLLFIIMVAFIVNSFIILPLLARIYGCGHCPQKSDCPWMVKEKETSQVAILVKN